MTIIKLLLSSILILAILPSVQNTVTDDFIEEVRLGATEADEAILKDFLLVADDKSSIFDMRVQFEEFKKEWTKKMVEFLIQELMINEESAKEARKNP